VSSPDLVHFDELEAELDELLREMLVAFAAHDPSKAVESSAVDDIALEFAEPYIQRFVRRLKELGFGLTPAVESSIVEHFEACVSEYNTVDTVVAAKVEDQTPELGVQALISEHKTPIMQKLQETDEGWTFLGDSATARREKRHV
jgi:hypothetical protein